jgi:hypothetical protein
MLAHHVYWLSLSIDKACELLNFYTGVTLSQSQVDKLLYQLSHDWEIEYSELAELIAHASIIYIDETVWNIGKKACYTWFFGTIATTYYLVAARVCCVIFLASIFLVRELPMTMLLTIIFLLNTNYIGRIFFTSRRS